MHYLATLKQEGEEEQGLMDKKHVDKCVKRARVIEFVLERERETFLFFFSLAGDSHHMMMDPQEIWLLFCFSFKPQFSSG